MSVALGDWVRGWLFRRAGERFTGLASCGRRSRVPRDYSEWAGVCAHELNGIDTRPADDEANGRAEQMLRDELGSRYGDLVRQGYLDVPSTLFRNTSYRLRMRRPIEVFKSGRRQPWRLCIVSIERVPPADELMMKLLWLRANEEYVLATANRVR